MKKALVLVALVVMALFIAGCSSEIKEQASDQKTTSEVQSDTTEDVAAETPAANVEPKPVEKDLKQILAAKVKYTVDYDVTAEGQTIKMTMAMDAPKFATLTSFEGGKSHTIFDGSSFVICSYSQEWTCFKQEVQEPETLATENAIAQGNAQTVFVGACTVAGYTGVKYSVTAEGMTSTVCYTLDGILLEIVTPQSTMTATKVSKSVDSALFTPEATPQDLSALMANLPSVG